MRKALIDMMDQDSKAGPLKELQGLFPNAINVSVTLPFVISKVPGVYFVFAENGSSNIPFPDVDHVNV